MPGVVNAFNLIDGLNGLSSYVTISVAFSLSIIASHAGNAQVSIFLVLFRKISLNPAKILNIKSGILEEGYFADLVLFDPGKPLLIDRFNLLSKAKNTPFDGYQLFGEVLKTFVRGKEIYKSRNINDT